MTPETEKAGAAPSLASEPTSAEGRGSTPDAGERTNLRRTQVLEATVRVISERGAEGTRLIDVARAANVSIGLIQHYFETRDELLVSSFDFFNDLWIRDWERASRTEADPPQKLLTLLRLAAFEFEDWREVQWRIWVEFWSLCNRNSKFRASYAKIYDTFRRPFRDVIIEGITHGDFSPRNSIEDVVDRLTAQIEGLRVHALLEPARLSRERMFALLQAQVEQDLRFSFPLGSGGQP
jgi:TetR/AcrR family transcriptional repressor of bet genes